MSRSAERLRKWRILQNPVTGQWLVYRPRDTSPAVELWRWADAWAWVTLDITEGLIPA